MARTLSSPRAWVYPRVCGGTCSSPLRVAPPTGLSPRVRGNPFLALRPCRVVGSIPACAGEPVSSTYWTLPRRVYPRVWGEPRCGKWFSRCAGVYPRVCGGTASTRCEPCQQKGLSPRVRGNRGPTRTRGRRPGSIPACAGEPDSSCCACSLARVYPRVCGGTYWAGLATGRTRGLSPRVRGNQGLDTRLQAESGSIPACAGEPRASMTLAASPWVYPRVCGGTLIGRETDMNLNGLSPRVRGNLARRVVDPAHYGSIPACAGEPCRPDARRPH